MLPFVNLSADRENEYLGDGIAEDITNALASIDGLPVAATRDGIGHVWLRFPDIEPVLAHLGIPRASPR